MGNYSYYSNSFLKYRQRRFTELLLPLGAVTQTMNIGEQTTPQRCGSSDGALPEWRRGVAAVATGCCSSGDGVLLK